MCAEQEVKKVRRGGENGSILDSKSVEGGSHKCVLSVVEILLPWFLKFRLTFCESTHGMKCVDGSHDS